MYPLLHFYVFFTANKLAFFFSTNLWNAKMLEQSLGLQDCLEYFRACKSRPLFYFFLSSFIHHVNSQGKKEPINHASTFRHQQEDTKTDSH